MATFNVAGPTIRRQVPRHIHFWQKPGLESSVLSLLILNLFQERYACSDDQFCLRYKVARTRMTAVRATAYCFWIVSRHYLAA